jgi:polar amino acid transport system permease protein
MIRQFGWNEFELIVFAARWTIILAIIAFVGGGIGGLIVALLRTSDNRWARTATIVFIRIFQGTPLLMQLFLAYFGMAIFGFVVNPLIAAMVALTAHASAYLGEIWRGCIEAVPPGQSEAAKALGLRYLVRMRYVVLPQAARIAVAPTVGFLVQLLKETSLTSIIGFVELTREGQIITSVTFRPFLVFSIVAAIYFIMCWPLSLVARSGLNQGETNDWHHQEMRCPHPRARRASRYHARERRRRAAEHRVARDDQDRNAGRFPALWPHERAEPARRL